MFSNICKIDSHGDHTHQDTDIISAFVEILLLFYCVTKRILSPRSVLFHIHYNLAQNSFYTTANKH